MSEQFHAPRKINEVSFRLTREDPFKMIYREPEEVVDLGNDRPALTDDEIVKLAKFYIQQGAQEIQLKTPLISLRQNVAELVRRLKLEANAPKVIITTSGTDLTDWIAELNVAGLDEIRLNIDTLRWGRYSKITGLALVDTAKSGLQAAVESSIPKIVINMVVMKGVNADELSDFVDLVRETRIELRLHELIPISNNGWMPSAVIPWAQMKEDIESLVALVPVPTSPNEDALRFRIPEQSGTIAFVPHMGREFCPHCERLRFNVEGGAMCCRFSTPDFGLIEGIRSGKNEEELFAMSQDLWDHKPTSRIPKEELIHLVTKK